MCHWCTFNVAAILLGGEGGGWGGGGRGIPTYGVLPYAMICFQPGSFPVLYCMYTTTDQDNQNWLPFSLGMHLRWIQIAPSRPTHLKMVWHCMYILPSPQTKAMFWPKGVYHWPTHFRNRLSISIVDLHPQHRCWSYPDECRVSIGRPLPSRWRRGGYDWCSSLAIPWHGTSINFLSLASIHVN